MRRLAWLVALTGVAFTGAATAYVTAGPAANTAAAAKITICHATSSKTNPFVEESPNADGVLSAHAHHPDDIIPPFELVERGTTTIYPGKNMDAHYSGGYTSVELLANGCRPPTGAVSVITVPEAIIEPARTITVPATMTTELIVETFAVPAATETAPETTTVVTVPAQSETTVTFPERTVTLPPTTETVNEETVVRPTETVTLPGTTETVTAGATSTVLTVTGPDEVVDEGTVATAQAVITVPATRETTTEAAHTFDLLKHKHAENRKTVTETVPRSLTVPADKITVPGTTTTETIIETITVPATTAATPETTTVVTVEGGASVTKTAVVTVTTPSRLVHEQARVVRVEEKKLMVLVVHSCPPGTALYNGACHHIAHGKG